MHLSTAGHEETVDCSTRYFDKQTGTSVAKSDTEKALTKTSVPEAAAEDVFSLTRRQNEEVVTRESQSSDYHSIAMPLHERGYAATPAFSLEKLQLLTRSPTDKIFFATVRDKVAGSDHFGDCAAVPKCCGLGTIPSHFSKTSLKSFRNPVARLAHLRRNWRIAHPRVF
jgi:hypothetical protein